MSWNGFDLVRNSIVHCPLLLFSQLVICFMTTARDLRSNSVIQTTYSPSGDTIYTTLSMDDLFDNEAKNNMELTRFLNDYSLDLLYGIDEITAAIALAQRLCDSYERVHISLKRGLGADEYGKQYAHFGERISEVRMWTRGARAEVKKLKEQQDQDLRRDKESKEQEQAEREKSKVRKEEFYLREKIISEIQNMMAEGSTFSENIDANVVAMRELRDKYVDVCKRIDEFGEEFAKEFQNYYLETSTKVNEFLQNQMVTTQRIKEEKLSHDYEIEKTKIEQTDQSILDQNTRENEDKIALCKSLYSNICDRFEILETKCSVNISTLLDPQVLEKYDGTKLIDSDFNDLLDKISELGQANPSRFEDTKGYPGVLETRKSNLKTKLSEFKDALADEVILRDLTKEKMKNASTVGLKVKPFSGWGSKSDIYTFKSDFDKFVAPRYSKTLLPDYLKKNYLEGQALEIVREIHDLDKIWERLEISFGNVAVLLTNKLQVVESTIPLYKIKNDKSLVEAITKIRNCMTELSSLAKKHSIETDLYHSSNVAKIFHLIGDKRQNDITKKLIEKGIGSTADTWGEILSHLDNELKVKEQMLLFKKATQSERGSGGSNGSSRGSDNSGGGSNQGSGGAHNVSPSSGNRVKPCEICGATDHQGTPTRRGNIVINYHSCKKFVDMTPLQRFNELRRKQLCFQCLTPGLKARHSGQCFDKYKCPHDSHQAHQTGIHILICDKHKNEQANKDLLEVYKEKCVMRTSDPPEFSRNIALHVQTSSYGAMTEENREVAIYMLQTILVGNKPFKLFYDNGCNSMVCRKGGVDILKKQNRAICTKEGPMTISGVSGIQAVCPHGEYTIKLPLANGEDADMTGLCLDRVTNTFPTYNLKEVESDIRNCFSSSGGDPSTLPELPEFVGGNTDGMVGSLYLKWWPEFRFMLPNGLTIYESKFKNVDGSTGVVGGPHTSFAGVFNRLGQNHVTMSLYLTEIVKTYQSGYRMNLDVSLLGYKKQIGDRSDESDDDVQNPCKVGTVPDEVIDNTSNFLVSALVSDSDPIEDFQVPNEMGVDASDGLATEGSVSYSDPIEDFQVPNEMGVEASDGLVTEGSVSYSDPIEDFQVPNEMGVDASDGLATEAYSDYLCEDCEIFQSKDEHSHNICQIYSAKKPPRAWTKFEKIENAGTEVLYRCVRCRVCKDCKAGDKIELSSARDDLEQGVIDRSVQVDLTKGYVIAKLPFICDPTKKLVTNDSIAKRVYYAQLKRLGRNEKDKNDVIAAEKKLHDLGYVDYLDNLTEIQQEKIRKSVIKYFIPWRPVWNPNSVTTACRPVFDATMPTETGYGLNHTLAKGRNNMNKLIEIFLRWVIYPCAYHTDVQKMYNSVRLHEDHWNYQLYWWEQNLDPAFKPWIKVIKTAIYGVTSSGNQAERALRETANLQKSEYPRQAEVVINDVYVDDCLSGDSSYDEVKEVTAGLTSLLGKSGFILKGITISGFDPPEHLSNPDKSITPGGMKWFPKEDLLCLNIPEMNLGKKVRGKKSENPNGALVLALTRRQCAGRVGEIFDSRGLCAPITAGLKLDLSKLKGLDWDDFLPEDAIPLWKENFELISKLGLIRFKRAVVPEDAVSLDMETLEMSDSSLQIACAAVYCRFKRKNGEYSCQLLFARTKIVPPGTSIPRAELFAAVLNASTGHIVNLALKDYIKDRVHFTDSQVVLAIKHECGTESMDPQQSE